MKRAVSAVVAVVLVAAGVALIRHREKDLARLAPPEAPPVAVVVVAVRAGEVGGSISTAALIRSATDTTVSAQVGGSLSEVRFREGDAVMAGEVMARIDARILDDAVATAEAAVGAAGEELAKEQAIFARDRVLFDNNAIAAQAFDATKARLEAAKAAVVSARRALESARTRRSYAEVRAPSPGTVTARLAEAGDLAAPGKPLYTLQAPGPVRLISKLGQDSLVRLRVGDRAVFESGGRTVSAPLSRIYPAFDAAHLGTVETDLPGAPFGLAPGATVAARYDLSATAGLVVPVAALLHGLEETLVVRVDDGRAEPVPVAVLSEDGAHACVRGPLTVGERVVTGLPSELMALTAGTRLAARER